MTQPTQPNLRFEKFSQQLKTHIRTAFAMGVDAAKEADREKLGINDRIKVGHRFVDLEVKGHAELLETLISGPWINPAPLEDYDTIRVPPANYERAVTLEGVFFARVGLTTVAKIPNSSLVPVPKVLGPGVREFRLYLTDLSYIGANYRGQIRLTPTSPPSGEMLPDTMVITAGL